MKGFNPGKYIMVDGAKSFDPAPISREWIIDDIEIQQLLSKADRQLGRLDAFCDFIPNLELYTSMHIHKEATQSSKIEGTRTIFEDAILEQENVEENKLKDWILVQNFIKAIDAAVNRFNDWPFNSHLFTSIHKILMDGDVRGQNIRPGEYRNYENWIGGATIEDATFVPPSHEKISFLMKDLEAFANDKNNRMPELLKAALIHYQFETIHPFSDGNGRIGRLLIPLYLVQKSVIKKPVLFLSDFFVKHKLQYFDNLEKVHQFADLKGWLKFFLVAVSKSAETGVSTFEKILKLKEKTDTMINQSGKRTNHLSTVLQYLYKSPIITVATVKELTKVSQNTAYRIVDDLKNLGILKEVGLGKPTNFFWFKDYINLFSNED